MRAALGMGAGGCSKRALYSLGIWVGRGVEGRCSPCEYEGLFGHRRRTVDADPDGHQSPALGVGMASTNKGSGQAGARGSCKHIMKV